MQNNVDYSKLDLTNPNDWLTKEGLHEEFPQFPQETITYLFTNRKHKGLDSIIRKVGKHCFCNRVGFGHWLARG